MVVDHTIIDTLINLASHTYCIQMWPLGSEMLDIQCSKETVLD